MNRLLSVLERQLIRLNVGVVSQAVTGRIVANEDGATANEAATAATLSVVERALVLAKKSNADCVLQVQLTDPEDASRYFVWDAGSARLREVSKAVYQNAHERKRWRITGVNTSIEGKVIDVESGAVLAGIHMEQAAVDALPSGATFQLKTRGDELVPSGRDYGHSVEQPDAQSMLEGFARAIHGDASSESPTSK